VVGRGTPPQLPSPLLESLLLPSAVLGPEFHRVDQTFTTIDPRYLNFESDGDVSVEGERSSPPPPAPSTAGDSGAVPQNPDAFKAPAGPSLHLQDEDTQLWGHVLLDVEAERMINAVDVMLYPLPPPASYTVGALGASLWNPNTDSPLTLFTHRTCPSWLMSFLSHVSSPRGCGISLTIMRITPMTHLLTSCTGLMRTSPSMCLLPLQGRRHGLSSPPSPLMLLRGRYRPSNTCC
jgi:hypothetical protein